MYCIVFLDVSVLQLAEYLYRFLRRPKFCTKPLRMGKVVGVSANRLSYWHIKIDTEQIVRWVITRKVLE